MIRLLEAVTGIEPAFLALQASPSTTRAHGRVLVR